MEVLKLLEYNKQDYTSLNKLFRTEFDKQPSSNVQLLRGSQNYLRLSLFCVSFMRMCHFSLAMLWRL